ncbi:uncharacterized protein RHIMIDRAFT_282942, partial [Rhizopus microsporus ATCC 52813]
MNSAIATRKYYHNTQPLDLPPTPSSSSYNEKTNNNISIPGYGSIGSSSRIEGMQTTVSSNDDEGLYLLWTHQLLRERGFVPSPCWLNEEDYTDDTHIIDDDDSSVSGDEEDPYEKKRRLFSPTVSSGHNEHLYSYQSSLMSQNSIPSYMSQHRQEEQEEEQGHAFRGIFSTCFGKC